MIEIILKPKEGEGSVNDTYKSKVKELIMEAEKILSEQKSGEKEIQNCIEHLDMALNCLGFNTDSETTPKPDEEKDYVDEMKDMKGGSFVEDLMKGQEED